LNILSDITTHSDEKGSVQLATIGGSAGSLVHTLIKMEAGYKHVFLPGFQPANDFALSQSLFVNLHADTMRVYHLMSLVFRQEIPLLAIDHVVEGHPQGTQEDAIAWYEKILRVRRFWSVDDKECRTENSGMRAAFMANEDKGVKVVLAEPVKGLRLKGQVQVPFKYCPFDVPSKMEKRKN